MTVGRCRNSRRKCAVAASRFLAETVLPRFDQNVFRERTTMPAPYTGGCQCGSVRYVLAAEPVRTVACHCKECQRQSGSAFGMSMLVKKDSLTVTGLTKQFTRIADSGNELTGVFCPDCGVRVYHLLK